MNLWNNDEEQKFFKTALANYAAPEKLFYHLDSGYYAYIPKNYISVLLIKKVPMKQKLKSF
jgi:hypothetical protein